MAWTYILRCSDGSFYVGSARDLEQRVSEHDAGVVAGYTQTRRPVELVWAHESERVDEAWALERQIKGWGRAKRIALIEGRFADLPALSRSRSEPPG
jgi:putative endonuclease